MTRKDLQAAFIAGWESYGDPDPRPKQGLTNRTLRVAFRLGRACNAHDLAQAERFARAMFPVPVLARTRQPNGLELEL